MGNTLLRNLTLMTDLYQITMLKGYFESGNVNKEVVFDLFYRKNPFKGGYAIVAGLEQVIEYIKNLKFTTDDISYLKNLNIFDEKFLLFLKSFKFTGDIYAIPEGTVVTAFEPLIRVKAPLYQAQFIETAILNIVNHQSLIATKASKVVHAANGDSVMEFGLRRAQGPDAANFGARAAIIGGCMATSNVMAGKLFNIPVKGTHAHSWVMSFDSELEAFRAYAKSFPDAVLLLVDTYDTLKSGVPNAIQVFKELRDNGINPKFMGIRLDSGDLAYLSKEARKMLDDAGFTNAIISASNDLDDKIILSLKSQGAKIDLWGVGTKLITAEDNPAFGGVYKLVAEINDKGENIPKIKISDNIEKITNPGIKNILRVYDSSSNKIIADLLILDDEDFDVNDDLKLYDPTHTWKNMVLKGGTYVLKKLLEPIFVKGRCVYNSPTTMEIQDYCKQQLETVWGEYKRLYNPDILKLDLSDKLYDLKKELIFKYKV